MLIGTVLTIMVPLIVLLGFSVVVLRYGFSIGFPWLSESFVWLNGIIFTLGAAYLLQLEAHVRVDVVYSRISARKKAVVNIGGVIFLLWPAMYVVGVNGWPTVLRSIRAMETSPTMDGLPYMYIMKACIPVFCLLVSLQGLSMLIRNAQLLCGDEPHDIGDKSAGDQNHG